MKPGSKLFYSYLFFIITYSAFVLLPAPQAITLLQYGVSATTLRLIYVTIILLLAVIWFIGFYGYAKLQNYSGLIRDNKDGAAVDKMTKGIFLLVMWLPVSSVISAILNFIAERHTGWIPAVTIIDNYINLILPLAGFVFISMGARLLSRMVRQRPSYKGVNALVILVIYISLIYFRLVATTHNRAEIYHMSIWLILTTLVAPYVYMWAAGLLAAYEIYLYHLKVAGIVYRKSWRFLAIGLSWLIVTSILFQYLTTLTARMSHWSIYGVLALIYSLLVVLSVGFIFVTLGSRKLQRIEEV